MVPDQKESNDFESPSIGLTKMTNANLVSEEEFDDESLASQGADETSASSNGKTTMTLAHDEDRAVWRLKWAVVTLLYTHQGQTQVYPLWPFVMLPGRSFHYLAEKAAVLADTMSISIAHIGTMDQKEAWKMYIKENRDWLPEAQAAMNGISLDQAWNESISIPGEIINLDKQPPYMVTNEMGPYGVMWQNYPAYNHHMYSFNLLSHPHYHDNIKLVVAEGCPGCHPQQLRLYGPGSGCQRSSKENA
ncbi:hypothetical protein SEMRO_21_G014490.1 [Seminavis robusta]|uniref:Uncharacterized protein n=1 Tax=Seminavis robusta TaxID=568900 RepID=A0A9N8H2L2_9STRA|nr:hypothetical protein SEMRO_21_G014490.1 [Seminavis robusta]|eukprot:Sro21_g014490.1 n/a (247) ;mRNA; r:3181-4090